MKYLSIEESAQILADGGIVAIPTETVYGLAGNAFNEKAVARIFAAKERPFFDPLIVHITDIADLELLAESVPKNALLLAEKFWAGPLTLILPKKKSVPDLTTGGLPTVAVRMPKKQIAIDIIKLSGVLLAAPSANLFQRLSPTTAEHVKEQLGDRIDGIVDGGTCEIGVESSVVGFVGDNGTPIIYRQGAITEEMIESALNLKVKKYTEVSDKFPSPGLLSKHYSPNTPLTIGIPQQVPQNSALLAFGELPHNAEQFKKILNLSPNANAIEAAANLYNMLHLLDESEVSQIFAAKLPELGLGKAVNDRLKRAEG
ncbi:threonylcarbamoyl-AMP synthase [Fibrobacterales bacterium]|nr:threonylcarbamoyl-AMP synthase [Fibrobacterales bacterium]